MEFLSFYKSKGVYKKTLEILLLGGEIYLILIYLLKSKKFIRRQGINERNE